MKKRVRQYGREEGYWSAEGRGKAGSKIIGSRLTAPQTARCCWTGWTQTKNRKIRRGGINKRVMWRGDTVGKVPYGGRRLQRRGGNQRESGIKGQKKIKDTIGKHGRGKGNQGGKEKDGGVKLVRTPVRLEMGTNASGEPLGAGGERGSRCVL